MKFIRIRFQPDRKESNKLSKLAIPKLFNQFLKDRKDRLDYSPISATAAFFPPGLFKARA